ncbi:NHLP family bacteriocin export ABC transporter peptidase/permease/ATPase subunit [Thalassospira tepidiphila]|jgi:NHLM bacteriocin system ABC transporter peptidase/ATP-binding protein|uniref:NHLP family bacteriocin export ABC transporter peptidase/permease/ATPase subunit n=1 Tax=Thalassospira tepidiphila TaxID=393657 RepID=UPI001BCC39E0|nr:NHLP family bacteriocin export ABC transporter peptidase/permease/ATPase subunit [Thalassospira tepidiphila]MBS8273571.1 NHLP family bacteriocin export ABC transporter peptidase/permease/ATPase subunit [Thalassospira tepidiphila]
MADQSKPDIRNSRVKTPTLLQMEAVECGAAALGIILAHYGKWCSLEELRTECGVSRDGSKAKNVLYGARRYGLEAKGFKAGVDSALSKPFPFIVFWNFNHFLVVEGYKNGNVYLNDPASGPRVVSYDEFDASFTGVMLLFSPGDNFVRDSKPPHFVTRLLPRTRTIRNAVVLAVLISLTLVVPGLLVPGFSKVFIDEYLIQGHHDWLRPLLACMVVTAIVMAILGWMRQSLLLRMESKLALTDSARFVWHVLRLPIAFFMQRHPGDISNRIDANDRIAGIIAGQLGESLVSAVTVIFYGTVMFCIDWLLSVVAISLALINVMVFKVLARRRADASLRLQQDFGQFQAASVTGIQAIETLKASGTDDDYFSRWSGFQAKNINNNRKLGIYGVVANAFPPLLDGLTIAAVLGIGGYRIIDGVMTVGTLVAFQALIQSFTGPINALVAVGGAFQELGADLARSDDVFGHKRDQRYDLENRETPSIQHLSGHIELKGLTFGYSPLEPPLIEDFDLTIRSGARVALVGGSGSGKSTVARLISGLYQPWSGEIQYDGVSLKDIPTDVLTSSLGAVSQEVFLFGGTVRDNLNGWDATVPDSDMVAALHDARIFDVIAGRGGGLDAEVAEGGTNFSGGQAQRLEIARALTSRPSILILDEATSALDPATEREIDENIRRRGCTCVIVAHRLSTVRDADEIVVLEFGKVVERGTHDELVAAEGAYARLIAQE